MSKSLDDERRRVAEEIFEMSEPPSEVVHSGGYESDGEDSIHKPVYVFNDANPEDASVKVGFGVTFAPGTAEVLDVHGDFDASPWWDAQREKDAPRGP